MGVGKSGHSLSTIPKSSTTSKITRKEMVNSSSASASFADHRSSSYVTPGTGGVVNFKVVHKARP